MRILVLGIGNALMRDDAFGVRAVETLRERYAFPPQVELVDGGTLGLDLLPLLEGVDRLLVLDALELGEPPGTVLRLEGEEVPRVLATKVSVHQMGLRDLLAVAELQGHLPGEMVIWGVQPASVEMGLELDPRVASALEDVVAGVYRELASWGAAPSKAA